MSAKSYINFLAVLFALTIISQLWPSRSFSQTATCNYYASPTGTGNGLSPSSPFKIGNFWSVASPGKVLCLLDGTYTGSSSMINPPQNLRGLSGSPITIRALNDGKVLLDGQKGSVPVGLYYNDW